MMHAFRSVRNHPIIPRSFLSSSITTPVIISKRICSFRSKGFASLSSQQESARIMDRAENPETGDVMYQFGHEYATRCEDEGFGVTHIIKQSVQTAENLETGDVMYQFGHEYATRCEDEGFGVTHSIKQSEKDDTHGSQFGKFLRTPLLHDMTIVAPNIILSRRPPFVIRIHLLHGLVSSQTTRIPSRSYRKYSSAASVAGSNVDKKKETPAAEEKVQHRANK